MGGGFLFVFFTCLGQPQLCVQVIEHLHSELEPAGEKLIPSLDRKEALLRTSHDTVKRNEQGLLPVILNAI